MCPAPCRVPVPGMALALASAGKDQPKERTAEPSERVRFRSLGSPASPGIQMVPVS